MFSRNVAVNSKDFIVYRSGNHICGHHAYPEDETDDDEADVEMSEQGNLEQVFFMT
jgi:hypothetical protein